MASIGVKNFFLAQNIASNTEASDLTEQNSTDFIGFLKVENYVSGTYVVLIQHSADKTNWETLATFGNLAANGFEYIAINVPVLPYVRSTVTVTTGDADVTTQLFFDPNK